jgi:hypothetical protein
MLLNYRCIVCLSFKKWYFHQLKDIVSVNFYSVDINRKILKILKLILFYFTSAVFGVELKASHLLGRLFTTWAPLPALITLVVFEIVSYPGWPGPWNSYLYFLCSWDDKHWSPHPTFNWFKRRVLWTSPHGSHPRFPGTKIIGLSHHTWSKF